LCFWRSDSFWAFSTSFNCSTKETWFILVSWQNHTAFDCKHTSLKRPCIQGKMWLPHRIYFVKKQAETISLPLKCSPNFKTAIFLLDIWGPTCQTRGTIAPITCRGCVKHFRLCCKFLQDPQKIIKKVYKKLLLLLV
jgi:hypothetical protein